MERSRQQVQLRRQAAIMGILGGVVLYVLTKLMLGDTDSLHEEGFRSLFFGDVEHWPSFVKGFVPVDLAFTCIFFWVVMYFALVKSGITRSANDNASLNARRCAWLAVGVFCGAGAFGGIMGSILAGWYIGIEWFFAMGVFATLFMGGMLALMGLVFGFGNLAVRVVRSVWGRARHTRLAQPLIKFGRYMDAKDVPEDANTS